MIESHLERRKRREAERAALGDHVHGINCLSDGCKLLGPVKTWKEPAAQRWVGPGVYRGAAGIGGRCEE